MRKEFEKYFYEGKGGTFFGTVDEKSSLGFIVLKDVFFDYIDKKTKVHSGEVDHVWVKEDSNLSELEVGKRYCMNGVVYPYKKANGSYDYGLKDCYNIKEISIAEEEHFHKLKKLARYQRKKVDILDWIKMFKEFQEQQKEVVERQFQVLEKCCKEGEELLLAEYDKRTNKYAHIVNLRTLEGKEIAPEMNISKRIISFKMPENSTLALIGRVNAKGKFEPREAYDVTEIINSPFTENFEEDIEKIKELVKLFRKK